MMPRWGSDLEIEDDSTFTFLEQSGQYEYPEGTTFEHAEQASFDVKPLRQFPQTASPMFACVRHVRQ
jgi:hypothetical protein